jgi:hypothetical protein
MLNSKDLIGISDDELSSHIGEKVCSRIGLAEIAGRLTRLSNGDWGVKVRLRCGHPGCDRRETVYLIHSNRLRRSSGHRSAIVRPSSGAFLLAVPCVRSPKR